MPARPSQGGSNGTWGTELNAHLDVALDSATGNLKSAAVIAAGAATDADLDAHVADTSAAHAASAIAFTPTGTVAATDVQAAIAEVASESGVGGIAATIVDAKGDLISATAADTPARLAVGANGTVLTANSAQSTGLEWTAAAGGGMEVSRIGSDVTAAPRGRLNFIEGSFVTIGVVDDPGGNEVEITIGADAVPMTLVNVKGDLLVANASDSVTRLAVGANNKVLMADSAQATGVKWGDAVLQDTSDAYTLTGTVTARSLTAKTWTVSNVTTDRTYDANAYTADELADALGTLASDYYALQNNFMTLVQDLKDRGIIG